MTRPALAPVHAEVSVRNSDGKVLANIDGRALDVRTVPGAISELCAEAMARGIHIIAVVVEPGRKRHLSISSTGQVRESAPPAHDLSSAAVASYGHLNLGSSADEEADTLAFVDAQLFGAGQNGAVPVRPQRERRNAPSLAALLARIFGSRS